jgi:hypothetical protein
MIARQLRLMRGRWDIRALKGSLQVTNALAQFGYLLSQLFHFGPLLFARA